MDLFRLDGKHVVITGASSGFGHHFAGVLSAAGARVALGARRVDRVAARVDEIRSAGGAATGIPLDVRSAESIRQFFDAAEEAFGPIDVVINNAGTYRPVPLLRARA